MCVCVLNTKMLARKNPLKCDGRIVLTDDHRYVLDGKHQAPISVTKAIEGQASHPFHARDVIRKHLVSWRSDASSKYHDVVRGKDDSDATSAVLAVWDATAAEGTSLHHQLELMCNAEPCTEPDRHATELAQFGVLMRGMEVKGHEPFRTELSLMGLRGDGTPFVAGQLDLLTKDEVGRHHIVDFKRTDKDLDRKAPSYGKRVYGLPDNAHFRYSLQLSLYAELLLEQEGIDVASLTMAQMHPNLVMGKLTPATDLRPGARALLAQLREGTLAD